jgi:serine phosphatase RsbU (regulator of sigma subunit)
MKAEMNLVRRHQRGLVGEMDKLDRELRLAARIQKQFMPQALPDMPGVTCEVFFQPAGYVSGDIYDVLRIGEHHLGFYIADAVGHGVPAALLTMFIKQAMPTHEVLADSTHIIPPHDALAQINSALCRRQTENVYFVTACYGLLDTRSNKLRLASAGHPAPFLFKSDGSQQQLEARGPLLGVFEEADFETREYQLEPGDRLLLYSDGNGPPHEALQRLKTKISEQTGSLNQDDDLTALLLDIVGQPSLVAS